MNPWPNDTDEFGVNQSTTEWDIEQFIRRTSPDVASRILKKQIKNNPSSPLVFYGLALLAESKGDLQLRNDYARDALRRDPDHTPTLSLLPPDMGWVVREQAITARQLDLELDNLGARVPHEWPRVATQIMEIVRSHAWYVRAPRLYFRICTDLCDLTAARALFGVIEASSTPDPSRYLQFAKVLAACNEPVEAVKSCIQSLREIPQQREAEDLIRSIVANNVRLRALFRKLFTNDNLTSSDVFRLAREFWPAEFTGVTPPAVVRATNSEGYGERTAAAKTHLKSATADGPLEGPTAAASGWNVDPGKAEPPHTFAQEFRAGDRRAPGAPPPPTMRVAKIGPNPDLPPPSRVRPTSAVTTSPGPQPRWPAVAQIRKRLEGHTHEKATQKAKEFVAENRNPRALAGLVVLFRRYRSVGDTFAWLPPGQWGEFARWLYEDTGIPVVNLPVNDQDALAAAGLIAAAEGRWRVAASRFAPAGGLDLVVASQLMGDQAAALAALPALSDAISRSPLPKEVLPIPEEYLTDDADPPQVLLGFFKAYSRGQMGGALRDLPPNLANAYTDAVIRLSRGDTDAADDLFHDLAEQLPNQPLFRWGLVAAAIGEKRFKDALRLLKLLLGSAPEPPGARRLAAALAAQAGDFIGVTSLFRKGPPSDLDGLALAVHCANIEKIKDLVGEWLDIAAKAYRAELEAEVGPHIPAKAPRAELEAEVGPPESPIHASVPTPTVPPAPPPPGGGQVTRAPLPPDNNTLRDAQTPPPGPSTGVGEVIPNPPSPDPTLNPSPKNVGGLLRSGDRREAYAMASALLVAATTPENVRDLFVVLRTEGDEFTDRSWVPQSGFGPVLFRLMIRRESPESLEAAMFEAGIPAKHRLRAEGLVAFAEQRWEDAARLLLDGPEAMVAKARTGDWSEGAQPPSVDDVLREFAESTVPDPKKQPPGITPMTIGRFSAAYEEFEHGRWGQALDRYEEIARRSSNPVEVAWARAAAAVALCRLGDAKNALGLILPAPAAFDRDPTFHLLLGSIQILVGRYDAATKTIQQTLEINKEHNNARTLQALLELRSGRPAKAEALLESLKRPDLRSVVGRACLGYAVQTEDVALARRATQDFESTFVFVAKLPPVPHADEVAPTLAPPQPPPPPPQVQSWTSGVRVYSSPADGKARFGCQDLFVAWAEPRPVFLLADGSPGAGSGHEGDTRRRLFRALSSVWHWFKSQPPAVAFDWLAKVLYSSNKTEEGKVYCSATVVVPGDTPGTWSVAEVGDTKAFLIDRPGAPAAPVLADGLPTGDHYIQWSLGTNLPRIRSRQVNVPSNGALLLVTDGAYHLLRGHNLTSADGAIDPSAVDRFQELLDRSPLPDDATLVRLPPPPDV